MDAEKRTLIELLAEASRQTPNDDGQPKRKALIWARVSTDKQEQRGLSIPEQLRENRDYAEQLGIEIIEEYHEAASAFRGQEKRVEFNKMVERAKSDPEITDIIVHELSRFSRDAPRAQLLIRELRESGVKVVSVTDPDFDPETDIGVIMEALAHAKNEAESRKIAFHTRKGCRGNAQTRDPDTGWCYWNGGQPVWGFRVERLNPGEDRGHRPIIKTIIVPDGTVVQGKPVHEWAKECLELASKGKSLAALCDFCNQHGVPAPRGKYWQVSTWNSLLQPHSLLTYCGYGVWDVHRKNGTAKPMEEWLIVENAHAALISEETAVRIHEIRMQRSQKHGRVKPVGKSRVSDYILSGGLFKCQRCGSNVTGYRSGGYRYYVCGSKPYRKGLGCGQAVYIPMEPAEKEVVDGIRDLLTACADDEELIREINKELERTWRDITGHDPQAERKLKDIDRKIGNIRERIEDGFDDVAWGNSRLGELKKERDRLERARMRTATPPRINPKEARKHLGELDRVMSEGTAVETKDFVRCWVESIEIAPDSLEVNITYKAPELLLESSIAGGGFEPPTSGL